MYGRSHNKMVLHGGRSLYFHALISVKHLVEG